MNEIAADAYVDESALVEADVAIGSETRIWHQAHVRTRARIGERCVVGKGAFIDFDVVVGDDCKLQNYACIYHGATLGRGVFVGPHAIVTNDLRPRATSPTFAPLRDGEWTVGITRIDDGASIGANATIVAGANVGRFAMIGAGAVVTRDVEAYALVVGSPARRIGWVCACGSRVDEAVRECERCGPLAADHPLRVTRAGS